MCIKHFLNKYFLTVLKKIVKNSKWAKRLLISLYTCALISELLQHPTQSPISGGTATTTITTATITGWQAGAGGRGAHVARPAPGHAPAPQPHQHRYQAPGAWHHCRVDCRYTAEVLQKRGGELTTQHGSLKGKPQKNLFLVARPIQKKIPPTNMATKLEG